ncbi:unnamed protein product [Cochlearia groenlandica]
MKIFCFFYFFLLTCALSSLSYASAVSLGRRYLSDDDNNGDAAGALPTPLSPIYPPFFPLESSAPPPPPPPTPTTFAVFPTFPANISALVLPRSPKPHSTSPKLLVPAISAVLVVATALGVALFLYGRWKGQNRHFKETSTCNSSSTSTCSSSHGYDDDEQGHVATTNNFSVAATTSTSEVLYLQEPDRVITSFVKPESPEIRPLPPLPPRSFHHNQKADFDSEEEGEEDEFFSPLACSENTSPSRSPEGPYSHCSSPSGWVSPARSFSMALSPVKKGSNFRYSDVSYDQTLQSPSPERLRVRKNNGHVSSSLRMFSFFNQNLGFPRISSASTSPERGGFVRTPLSSLYSSVSNSPDGFLRRFLDSSPPIWNDFSRNVKSVLLSSDSISSRRDVVINIGDSSSPIWNQPAAIAPPPTRPPPLVPPSQPIFSEFPAKQHQWEQLRSSSIKLNKEMVETMFIDNSSNIKQRGLSCDFTNLNQESKVLDPRKAHNIATLLQLLNLTTKDVCKALLDGDYDALGVELLECLSLLAPSKEEERKLRSYSDGSVNIKLGPAERFLKELLHVPFVFKRVDALLSVANFHSETKHLRRSFGVVQAACEELKNSRMFSMLLEAILKTGNKMNVRTNRFGDAHAFKLDMLLELVQVKGLDRRSSLLHFVVQEMIKSEGAVKALDRIRNLNSELGNVKKSAVIEYPVLRSDVSKHYQGIKNIEKLLRLNEGNGSSGDQWLKFRVRMSRFLETAAEEIAMIKRQESSTISALEEVTEQFNGDSYKEGHTMRVFMIVRDFLSLLDNVCNEMGDRFLY